MIFSYLSDSVTQTEAIGAEIAKQFLPGDFIAMYGDLGAGKTALVRGIASVLAPDAIVQSPTYTIINEYQGNGITLCHCDMYRIESEDDLESIGFYDYKNCIFFVEWAEKISFALPYSYYKLTILTTTDTKRSITLEKINRLSERS